MAIQILIEDYRKKQEQLSPKFQRFFDKYLEAYGGAEAPQALRDKFRAGSLPLMKYTNILSFNTRVIALFIALFLRMLWLYFVFEITVLNVLLVYMIYKHEQHSERMMGEIEN